MIRITQTLKREAALVLLQRGRNLCLFANDRFVAKSDGPIVCSCGECLLQKSIRRGQKLIAKSEKPKKESLKEVSATPFAMLNALLLGGLNNGITVIFFSFAVVSLSLLPVYSPTIQATGHEEGDQGEGITEDIISQVGTIPKDVPLLMPSVVGKTQATGQQTPAIPVLLTTLPAPVIPAPVPPATNSVNVPPPPPQGLHILH